MAEHARAAPVAARAGSGIPLCVMAAEPLTLRPGTRPADLASSLTAAAPRAVLAGIAVLAAVLRFDGLGAMQLNPYYDAAVRSMGSSWHAFLVGAFNPNASVAIDKPPVDLWLQVASTKLFGFTPFALCCRRRSRPHSPSCCSMTWSGAASAGPRTRRRGGAGGAAGRGGHRPLGHHGQRDDGAARAGRMADRARRRARPLPRAVHSGGGRRARL